MIPKVIHWCWLSGEPLPAFLVECMQTWRQHLPDYEIKQWNTKNFDVNSVSYVSEAVKARKWAFACDYIRAYALYTEGGIYLDSDVFVKKNFDFVLSNQAFSAVETYPERITALRSKCIIDDDGNKAEGVRFVHGAQIQAAILGAEKGHPFFRDVLDYYHTHSFIKEDGSIDTEMISPFIYANLAVKYGFKYIDKAQQLAHGFMLYDSSLFAPMIKMATESAYAIHCCNASWREKENQGIAKKLKQLIEHIKVFLLNHNIHHGGRVKYMKKL